MNHSIHFMIIDDDPLNNLICSTLIKSTCPDAQVISFTYPQKALDYIRENSLAKGEGKTIMLLDINMPLISGWDILDELAKMGAEVVNRFSIYMLSSSVDERDIARAGNHPHVIDYLTKPLQKHLLKNIVPANLPGNLN